jgi:hypothetical protein
MDPKIVSPKDQSEGRLAAIQEHCNSGKKAAIADGIIDIPAPRTAGQNIVQGDRISAPWAVSKYNTFLSFEKAEQTFLERNGPAFIKEEVEPLIKKRWLRSKIAVGLLYQNFGLHKGEKLVYFNLTATPWTVKNDNGVFNLRVREEA